MFTVKDKNTICIILDMLVRIRTHVIEPQNMVCARPAARSPAQPPSCRLLARWRRFIGSARTRALTLFRARLVMSHVRRGSQLKELKAALQGAAQPHLDLLLTLTEVPAQHEDRRDALLGASPRGRPRQGRSAQSVGASLPNGRPEALRVG